MTGTSRESDGLAPRCCDDTTPHGQVLNVGFRHELTLNLWHRTTALSQTKPFDPRSRDMDQRPKLERRKVSASVD